MGFLDKAFNLTTSIENARNRDSFSDEINQLGDKSLALREAGRLTPEVFARLANKDDVLINEFATVCSKSLASGWDAIEEIRAVAKEAYVLVLTGDV